MGDTTFHEKATPIWDFHKAATLKIISLHMQLYQDYNRSYHPLLRDHLISPQYFTMLCIYLKIDYHKFEHQHFSIILIKPKSFPWLYSFFKLPQFKKATQSDNLLVDAEEVQAYNTCMRPSLDVITLYQKILLRG